MNNLCSMVFAALFAAVLLVSTSSAFAGEPVSTDVFVGNYVLLKTKLGMCNSRIVVDQTYIDKDMVDLNIGSFTFTRVNQDEILIDDRLVRLKTKSYTTADASVVGHRELLTKPSKTMSVEETVAKLKGDKLHIKSTTVSSTPGESNIEFGTECVYRRVETTQE